MNHLEVNVKVLPHGEGLPLPEYKTQNSSGMDLYAAIHENELIVLHHGEQWIIPTGICVAPINYSNEYIWEAQVRPRSGLAAKHGVTVLNTPGTIDADYRGEIKVILINLGTNPIGFRIARGDRIAQLVFNRVGQAHLNVVSDLDLTKRNQGGFGSTGSK